MLPWKRLGLAVLRLVQLRSVRYGLRLTCRIKFGPTIIRRAHRWAGYNRATAHQVERAYRQALAAELDELLRRPSGLSGDDQQA